MPDLEGQPTDDRQPSHLFAVFLVSCSVLLFELTLIRIFSVVMRTNLAFLAISLTLFGVALGGLLVDVFDRYFHLERTVRRLRQWSAVFALSLTAFPFPFLALDFRVPWQQAFMLPIACLLAATPFVVANVALTLVFRQQSARFGRVYFADLLGAASGVSVAIVLLNFLPAGSLFFVAAGLAFVAAVLFSTPRSAARMALIVAAVLVTFFLPFNQRFGFVDIRHSRGGADHDIIFTKWNSFSRVTVHQPNPGPGGIISLPKRLARSFGELGIRIDADAYTSLPQYHGDPEAVAYLKSDLASLVFRLAPPGKSLIIGPGGGRDVLIALLYGYQVRGVDINPIIVNDIVKGRYREFGGNLYGQPGVEVSVAEGRSFLQRNRGTYQVIALPLVDTWASTVSGNLMLVESYLYTVEAFEQYLNHLAPDGVLNILRWEHDGLRLLALFFEASRRLGIEHPERNFLVVSNDENRQLNTYVFQKVPVRAEQWERTEGFLAETGFAGVYSPLATTDNAYSAFARATDWRDYARTTSPQSITPVFDDSPFFFSPQLLASNEIVSVVAMVAAMSVVIILFPILMGRRARTDRLGRRGMFGALAYMGVLGVAFFFIELTLIQQFVLYLEQPIFSYSVVLASLLLFAGLGSAVSTRLPAHRTWPYLGIGAAIAGLALLDAFFLKAFIDATMTASLALKIVAAGGLTAPIAFGMGMMLPLGMRRLNQLGASGLVPWCWAVTGATSVFASTFAVLLAIVTGFRFVMLIGGGLYVIAWVLMALVPRVSGVGKTGDSSAS